MLVIKDIKRNKSISIIIVIMIMISLIAVNIIFNVFFDASIKFYESNKLAKKNEILSIIFGKEQTKQKVDKLISNMASQGVDIAYTRNTTFKGELFDTTVDIQSISSSNIFKYNVIKGRNITLSDIEKGKKVAVISKNYESFCQKYNDKVYIDIDNDRYEVIGIEGNKYSSSYYNLMIFIPYTASPKAWGDNNTLSATLITSNKNIEIQSYRDKFNIKDYSYSSFPIYKITNILFSLKQDLIYFAIISVISIINIMVFSIYWINKKKNQLSILKALGYSKKHTDRFIKNELLLLSLVASLASTIIYYPFSYFFNMHFFNIGLKSSPIIFFVDILFSYIFSLMVVLLNKRRIDKVSIASNINSYTNITKNPWINLILIIEIALVMNYSIEAFSISDYVYSTVNRANKIINIKNTEVVDPFTVSYDSKTLIKYNAKDNLKYLREKGIGVISYVYSIDSTPKAQVMKNKLKNYYSLNYSDNYFYKVQNDNIVPLIYIEEGSLDNLKLNIDRNSLEEDTSKDYTPVYAGYDYKQYFSKGDIIKADSGNKYKIVGFLNKDTYMFANNSGSDALSETNNLNSFFIIPYNYANMKNKLPPYYNTEDFLFYSICNSFFTYKSPQLKQVLNLTLDNKKIGTTSLNNQMKKFTSINFNAVSYKIFSVIIILLICISGLIGFTICTVFSDKRNTGIKIALGFNKRIIISEYIYKILKLFSIALILTTFKYIVLYSEIELTLSLFIRMIFLVLIIPIPSIVLIIYIINSYEARELIGGER